jgi:pimeloyl-ACP methyl ester carboxylesterase
MRAPRSASHEDTQQLNLHSEVHGTGPVLLMLAGGSGDADEFAPLVPYLRDRYTIVTYDRRGYTRSPIDAFAQTPYVSIETQSDDALRILAGVSDEPAFVFGSSLGAVIGLDLVSRYAERVRKLVAHEPPLVRLLSPQEGAAAAPAVRPGETTDEAIRRFTAQMGINRETLPRSLDPEPIDRERRGRKRANMEFFMAHEAGGVARYRADFARLKTLLARIVLAGGATGHEYAPYVMALRAAERLGIPLVEFPGNHVGYLQHPEAFAQQLAALLAVRPILG